MPGKSSRLCAGLDVYVGITTCSTFTQYFALRNVARWNTILIILHVLQSPGGHKPKHHYIHNVCDPKPQGDCCSIYLSMYCNYSIWSKNTARVLFGYFSRGISHSPFCGPRLPLFAVTAIPVHSARSTSTREPVRKAFEYILDGKWKERPHHNSTPRITLSSTKATDNFFTHHVHAYSKHLKTLWGVNQACLACHFQFSLCQDISTYLAT